MAIAETIVYKLYTGLAGTLATLGMHKLLSSGWRFVTGEEPPEPTDPDSDGRSAVLWAVASAIGLALAQVVTLRVGQRYFGTQGKRKHKQKRMSLRI